MMGNFQIIEPKEKEKSLFLMEMFTKVNGTKIWQMDLVSIYILQELYMKGIGKIIFNMDQEFNYGQIKANIKVIISSEKNMVKENILG
jgi:hypothetical protein